MGSICRERLACFWLAEQFRSVVTCARTGHPDLPEVTLLAGPAHSIHRRERWRQMTSRASDCTRGIVAHPRPHGTAPLARAVRYRPSSHVRVTKPVGPLAPATSPCAHTINTLYVVSRSKRTGCDRTRDRRLPHPKSSSARAESSAARVWGTGAMRIEWADRR
jgi:hypothetical protein